MSELVDALGRVVDRLREAGIDATTDPRDLNPPCAWVTVHDITTPVLCGSYEVRAAVCLIAGDAGSPQSLAALGAMLDTVTDCVTFDEPVAPMNIQPPGVGAPIPALVIVTTTN
ncbi:MAG: hypothetical protein AMXMBFR58_37510 [Phycisphaerae bacterium]